MIISDFIYKILDEFVLTPEEFGKSLNIGKSSVYKLLRGDTKKITKSMALKISSVYPKYTVESLLSLNRGLILDNKLESVDYVEKNGVKFTLREIAEIFVDNIDKFENEKIIKMYVNSIKAKERIKILEENIILRNKQK